MQLKAVRAVSLSTMVGLFLALLAVPSGAAPSGADLLLAAGAGQAFVSVGDQSTREASCWTDPADDVTNLESSTDAPIDEPRGDIVEHCATHGVTAITLTATVDEGTDPTADPNWQGGTLMGWFIDITGDGEGDFFAQLTLDEDGEVDPTLEDITVGGEAETECDGLYWTYADGAYTLRFGRDCLGDPTTMAVSLGFTYDQRVESTSGVATIDTAPGDDEFEDALSQGALTDPGVNRIDGDERIESAILGSQAAFDDLGASAVVLARADLFPDAQAGTPLAIAMDAPLLLSAGDTLSADTATEIQRVLPPGGTVYVLGGEAALSSTVDSDLTALGYSPMRLAGANRFETAAIIASEGLGSPSTVILADGADFADAVIAGAASYAVANQDAFAGELEAQVAAVLLTDGERLPDETSSYLGIDTALNTVTVGAEAAAAYPLATQSYAGETDAETSVLVAEAVFPEPTLVGIATEADFADALFGGALVGDPEVGPGPMLMTAPDVLTVETQGYLQDNAESIETAVIFGGPGAVDAEVEEAIVSALSPTP